VPVVCRGVAVDTDADAYTQRVEQFQKAAKADGVRLNRDADLDRRPDRSSYRPHRMLDETRAGEQWLATVQDDLDRRQVMGPHMFADSGGDPIEDLRRHPRWLFPPPLVCHFVHVAVVASKIAATVQLQDELPEGNRTPALCA
jgi:hypothetical protein